MREQLKKNFKPFLPLGFSTLTLVILLCSLSQATEAVPSMSSAETQVRNYPRSPDYETGVPVCQQTYNRVLNLGFENGIGCQDHWCYSGDCNFTADEIEQHSGDRSARIHAGETRVAACFLFTPNTERIPVEPHRFYDYSAWIKTTLVQGNAYLRITFWDDQGYISYANTTAVDTHGAWEKVTGSVQAPADAEYARIEPTLPKDSAGFAWFDDVFFGLATCLDISKSDDPDPVAPGGMLTYTIVYSNFGRDKATDVEIREYYDDYADTVILPRTQPPPDRGDDTWEIPELSSDESGAITVVVQVDEDTEDGVWLFNEVEICSDETVECVSAIITTTVFIPPTGVDIAGPTYGVTNTHYSFIATVIPDTVSPPITYTWSSTPIGEPDSEATYSWDTIGVKTIVVTATNEDGVATGTHNITITDRIVPLDGVEIVGPRTGVAQTSYTFVAVVSPVSATSPITYSWQATGQSNLDRITQDLSHTVAYTWDTTGTHTVTVTATNRGLVTVTNVHTITIGTPVEKVDINGPTSGIVGIDYTFTATVSPTYAAPPFTYSWEAVEQAPISPHSHDNTTDTVNLNWEQPGVYTVTVTAQNGGNPVDNNHVIVIGPVLLQGVNITGPSAGNVNISYTFTATTRPTTATPPITYTWEAQGQEGATTHTCNNIAHTVNFTWTEPGIYVITVTAQNSGNLVNDVDTITIRVPIEDVDIDGPTTGDVNTDHVFTAIVTPALATAIPPITYTWSPEPQAGQNSATVTYIWTDSGLQTITVTAENAGGFATDHHSITITAPPTVPLTGVIFGPTTCYVNAPCALTAWVSPTSATGPITYSWQATEQSEVTTSTNALNHTVVYTWITNTTQIVTVTAKNGGSATCSSDVAVEQHTIYLPLIMRCPPITPSLLQPIDNGDGDGSYTVSWGKSIACQSVIYHLQETLNCEGDFTGATEVYSGTNTSYDVEDRNMGHYYYRARACHQGGCSDWSNVEQVDVWHREDNDSKDNNANGPLCSGMTYYGTFTRTTDIKDYFYFDLGTAHSVELWLENIMNGHDYDLYLYDDTCTDIIASSATDKRPEHILPIALSQSKYCVLVHNYGVTENTEPYHLRVIYK